MKLYLFFLFLGGAAYSEPLLKPRNVIGSPREKQSERPLKRNETPDTESASVGILTGANFSSAVAEPDKAGSTRNGWVFRGFFELPIGRTFSLEASGGYVQRGANTTLLQVGILGLTGEVRLFYLEFSTLLKLRTKMLKNQLELWGGAGPSVAYAVIRELETKAGIQSDLSDRFDSTDFLLVVGGGASYHLTPLSRLLFQLRYNMGVKNIDLNPDSSYMNRGFELLLGFGFYL